MIDEEFPGPRIAPVMLAVLGVPFEGEVQIRRALVARVRDAPSPGAALFRAVTGVLAWLAYLPAILAYQALAVPLVVGSVVLTGALVGLAFVVGWPPTFVFNALRRRFGGRPG